MESGEPCTPKIQLINLTTLFLTTHYIFYANLDLLFLSNVEGITFLNHITWQMIVSLKTKHNQRKTWLKGILHLTSLFDKWHDLRVVLTCCWSWHILLLLVSDKQELTYIPLLTSSFKFQQPKNMYTTTKIVRLFWSLQRGQLEKQY